MGLDVGFGQLDRPIMDVDHKVSMPSEEKLDNLADFRERIPPPPHAHTPPPAFPVFRPPPLMSDKKV